MYNFGLIGNCQISALINQSGSIDWFCLPRPDSPPVFGQVLDSKGGSFAIESADPQAQFQQSYLPNTNILVTTVTQADGSSYQITDFCPRFYQNGRIYRPMSLFRILERKSGSPTVRVHCKPVEGWSQTPARPLRGSSHLRWEFRDDQLRLTTNMSLTYLCEETSFLLEEPLYFALTWGIGLEDELPKICHQFLDQTSRYWENWVKHCAIPSLYQKETIRSALALKLHCFEDTGAILAALTTSLPEEAGGTRNWDYRYCWLRDAYFVLSAFRNLGHFEEMEGFLKFLLSLAHQNDSLNQRLRPVYCLDQTLPLPEREHPEWSGYQDGRPVRSFNQAAEHIQNDVYGEMILTLAPIFSDERFFHLRTTNHAELLGQLANLCIKNISQADAGLWEIRNGWQEHSFSNLMCWAGLDRAEKIQKLGYLPNFNGDIPTAKAAAEKAVRAAVFEGSVRNGPSDSSFDSALIQLPLLRFPDRALCEKTVDRIAAELSLAETPSYLFRYKRSDDFGTPQSGFVICSYWLAQAYASLGRIEQAKKIMDTLQGLGEFARTFL